MLCLVNIVLMVLITNYQEIVNGQLKWNSELSDWKCNNTYLVSYDRVVPITTYFLATWRNTSVTLQSCEEWCNEDRKCRSVMYAIRSNGERRCTKFWVLVQELEDTGRGADIYNVTDKDEWPNLTTYDRTCTKYSETNCSYTYLVSHDRKRPIIKFRIRVEVCKSVKSSSLKQCQRQCDLINNCASVAWILYSNGSCRCDTYMISVQELKDTCRDQEIITNENRSIFPTYISYDKACDCPAGFEMSTRHWLGSYCKECKESFIKESAGTGKCKCPEGTVFNDNTTFCESMTTESMTTERGATTDYVEPDEDEELPAVTIPAMACACSFYCIGSAFYFLYWRKRSAGKDEATPTANSETSKHPAYSAGFGSRPDMKDWKWFQ